VTSEAAPVRRLWLAVLCGYLALGATLQELPGYVVHRFHAGPAVAGLAVAAAFAATAVARPFAGRAGDAGLARPVVTMGGVLAAVAGVGHLLAPDVGVLLLARLLMGAGEAALFSGALPWVLAGTPAGRRGRVAGWFGLSMWSGLAAGPLLAVLLHHLGGSTAAWWLVIVLPLVSTGLAMSTREPPRGPGRPRVRPGSWRDVVPAGAGLPGLCLGFAAYGYGTLSALLVLYLTNAHVGGQSVGLAVFAVAFLLTRAAGSPLIDRYGGGPVASCVLVIEAAGLALLAAEQSEPAALVATAITGIGIGLIYPAAAALTLNRTGAIQPGVAVGAMTSCWDLGILVAGPVGGLVATHVGYRPAFAVAAGMSLIALVIAGALRHGGPPRQAQSVHGEPRRRERVGP